MEVITFNELPDFTKKVNSILGGDDELMALQIHLAENPTQGDVIPKSHGLRKLRWQIAGRSKAAGARVIYYRWEGRKLITLCDLYSKKKKADLSNKEIKKIRGSLE